MSMGHVCMRLPHLATEAVEWRSVLLPSSQETHDVHMSCLGCADQRLPLLAVCPRGVPLVLQNRPHQVAWINSRYLTRGGALGSQKTRGTREPIHLYCIDICHESLGDGLAPLSDPPLYLTADDGEMAQAAIGSRDEPCRAAGCLDESTLRAMLEDQHPGQVLTGGLHDAAPPSPADARG